MRHMVYKKLQKTCKKLPEKREKLTPLLDSPIHHFFFRKSSQNRYITDPISITILPVFLWQFLESFLDLRACRRILICNTQNPAQKPKNPKTKKIVSKKSKKITNKAPKPATLSGRT